ncbi:MAG: tRNA (adenosine(37)-N6)-threonylcarbamoyltransferase complex dimerization subunit type 1 TsaB [Acutalibacteraceae bacterium]|nr:tRNA (adenosine(37)-N6)-threonylcarbamoyltransferase complex dimerization subunit type 1 TsaB [Clostridia bacterium]MEE3449905.1 tRNA (adenosine(37)-N6)-threonylcarbamoyltransferase complex dimerization subunit type 1 TsaB [Acutalibacteraceae bacterium]
MKIFAVDTSARSASVAIVEEGAIKGEYFINTMLTHSETLMPMTELLFKSTKCELKDIDVFAVNDGPGSFTGLRIGIAAVKGMAYAVGKPCVGISALESMAYNFSDTDSIICAVMDARCSQVYNALFEVENNNVSRLCQDRALSISELTEELLKLNRKVMLVGDGAQLCYSAMKDTLENVSLAPQNLRFQRASSTALVAIKAVNDGKTVSASSLMPKYLRLPQAQRELLAKQNKEKINN